MTGSLNIRKTSRAMLRRSQTCNECKRRKVRCSGDENCTNCVRDGKPCRYASPSQTINSLQKYVFSAGSDIHISFLTDPFRRLQKCEELVQSMKAAWASHVPEIDINETICSSRNSRRDAVNEHESSELVAQQRKSTGQITGPWRASYEFM